MNLRKGLLICFTFLWVGGRVGGRASGEGLPEARHTPTQSLGMRQRLAEPRPQTRPGCHPVTQC